jgi:four helix bundle protein
LNNYKELKLWQKAVELAVDIYTITKQFPTEEKFGLTSQINRCAVSVPSNIAEGAGRNTEGEFNHFLGISMGSACELETQLIIASKLKFIEKQQLEESLKKIAEIQNMTIGLKKSFKKL